MGSIEVRNPLLSKKLKRTETRLLIIDDNQIRFNQIQDLLTESEHQVQASLLDDLQNFEKQLNLNWDLIIFGRAYDLKYEQALSLVQLSNQPNLPIILLKPEDYQAEQYANYIRKGIYDILDLNEIDNFYLGLIRALSFSRLQQTQQHLMDELETAQTQTQALVEDSRKAVAVIQEGIHIQANAEYLTLFGLNNEDDVIGLPLLDLLQPTDLNDFKQRFKKISQGQFDLGRFDLSSQNAAVVKQNPLKLEFIAATEEDALQLAVDITTESTRQTTVNTENVAQKPKSYQQINRTMTKQPSTVNALVLFTLSSCSDAILQSNWNTYKSYFSNVKEFLKEQTHVPLFSLDNGAFVALFQADNQAKLDSKLIGLNTLSKPQLLTVNNESYPLNLRIGYAVLNGDLRDESHLEQVISQAFTTALPTNQKAPEIDLNIPLELEIPALDFGTPEAQIAPISVSNEAPVLKALRTSLERGEIHLKYQQLYDKEDSHLYTYEVTSGFIFENKWKDIAQLRELAEDSELSIKLDRWILVESCKQLHNFITQFPDAKLIVNLNKEVLYNDRTFPEFISKLITIIRSKVKNPLILQFSEEDIQTNLADAQKAFIELRKNGADLALRNFGHSMYSESLLRQVDVNCLTLDNSLTKMLANDKSCLELQEKIAAFNEIRNVEILLRELNDMTLFANAWNVEARFIQGDYFQKKLDHLIDIQDQ
ncbi:EAL domain-containing protein [Acinetobacter gandensis]|uniref:Diguanylate phosphodiesterase n=1 Tax=Acinetobacter gandensis TaxID=1443941 RepID=A0A1A7RCW1_9GAMM|nr:EAL domain-containing protein [Acinetobacter gandensis]KAB0623621.1 EAL domain-containing protein [Acinetobacter gandensis]OBX29354.1 diguanylate phosphodiesterase [Acinetobacter gandensis]